MTFDDQQFSVVLDKGTIDALMSNPSEQVRKKPSYLKMRSKKEQNEYLFFFRQVLADINQILDEVDRVLRVTGRFICITLAQKHILNHLSEYFFHEK